MHKTLASRIVGYIASLILTVAAFWVISNPAFFHIDMRGAIVVIFLFAFLQFMVQSICFLNVFEERGIRWNLMIYISTIAMVILIIMFTIWIMNHLDYNMMSH